MTTLTTFKCVVRWNGGHFNIRKPREFAITCQAETADIAKLELATLCGRSQGGIRGMTVLHVEAVPA